VSSNVTSMNHADFNPNISSLLERGFSMATQDISDICSTQIGYACGAYEGLKLFNLNHNFFPDRG